MTGPTVADLVWRSVAFARSYRRQARGEARLRRNQKRIAALREQADHCMRLARHLRAAGIKLRSYP